MRESIPLRARLQRHDDEIVVEAHWSGGIEIAHLRFGAAAPPGQMPRRLGITPVDRHNMDRVASKAVRSLRSVAVEGNAERDRLALLDQPCCIANPFRCYVVDRAQLVLGSPFTPIAHLIRHCTPVGHRSVPLIYSIARWLAETNTQHAARGRTRDFEEYRHCAGVGRHRPTAPDRPHCMALLTDCQPNAITRYALSSHNAGRVSYRYDRHD